MSEISVNNFSKDNPAESSNTFSTDDPVLSVNNSTSDNLTKSGNAFSADDPTVSVNNFSKDILTPGGYAWEGENLTGGVGIGDLMSGVVIGTEEAGGILHYRNRPSLPVIPHG